MLDRHYAQPFGELATRLNLVSSEVDLLAEQTDTANKAAAHAHATLDLVEDRGQRNQRAIETAKNSTAELSDRFGAFEELAASLSATVDRVRTDLESLSEKIGAVDQESTTRLDELSSAQTKVADTIDKLSSGQTKAADTIEELARSRDEVLKTLDHLTTALDDIRNDLQTITSRQISAEESMARKAETEVLNEVSQTQQRVLTHLAELQDDYDTVKEVFRDRDTTLQELNQERRQISAQIADLTKDMASIRATSGTPETLVDVAPEIRDRFAETASLLADAARERTILAEAIDRLSNREDES